MHDAMATVMLVVSGGSCHMSHVTCRGRRPYSAAVCSTCSAAASPHTPDIDKLSLRACVNVTCPQNQLQLHAQQMQQELQQQQQMEQHQHTQQKDGGKEGSGAMGTTSVNNPHSTNSGSGASASGGGGVFPLPAPRNALSNSDENGPAGPTQQQQQQQGGQSPQGVSVRPVTANQQACMWATVLLFDVVAVDVDHFGAMGPSLLLARSL